MDLEIVLRLEKKIDQLLEHKKDLEEECQRLRAENMAHQEDRERFRSEIDRILVKLDRLHQETP